jgi:hypothetical protein
MYHDHKFHNNGVYSNSIIPIFAVEERMLNLLKQEDQLYTQSPSPERGIFEVQRGVLKVEARMKREPWVINNTPAERTVGHATVVLIQYLSCLNNDIEFNECLESVREPESRSLLGKTEVKAFVDFLRTAFKAGHKKKFKFANVDGSSEGPTVPAKYSWFLKIVKNSEKPRRINDTASSKSNSSDHYSKTVVQNVHGKAESTKHASQVVHDKVISPVAHDKVISPVAHDKVISPVAHDKAISPVVRDKTVSHRDYDKVISPVAHDKAISPVAPTNTHEWLQKSESDMSLLSTYSSIVTQAPGVSRDIPHTSQWFNPWAQLATGFTGPIQPSKSTRYADMPDTRKQICEESFDSISLARMLENMPVEQNSLHNASMQVCLEGKKYTLNMTMYMLKAGCFETHMSIKDMHGIPRFDATMQM